MTITELITRLHDLVEQKKAKADELIYFGDTQESCDYLVRNADGKLTIKQEWF